MSYCSRSSTNPHPPHHLLPYTRARDGDEHFTDLPSEPYASNLPSRRHGNGKRSWHPLFGLLLYFTHLLILLILVFIISFGHLPDFAKRHVVKFLVGIHVTLLCSTGALERYLRGYHRLQLQRGFLKFCHRMDGLVPIPFAVLSYGSCVILGALLWQSFWPWALTCTLIGEIAIVGSLAVFYCWCVFIRQTWHPDAQEELTSVLRTYESGDNIDHRDGGELVEMQAAVIRFQQTTLDQLCVEILSLQEQLSKHARLGSPEAVRQVETAQLLSVREQEQRAARAEQEQLQTELQRALGMLGEEQDEAARLRNINQQYVDENARLRLMLDEWSARSAKLEIALTVQIRRADALQSQLSQGVEQASASA